jgi:hypothetical protein
LELRQRTLTAQTLGELLNETFAVYGRQFSSFVRLAAMVQVPVMLIAFFLGAGVVSFGTNAVLVFFAAMLTYAAGAHAVGQDYLTGRVSVADCYSRVSWRLTSLFAIGLVMGIVAGLGLVLSFVIIPLIVSLMYLVYWSVAVPAVVVEGHKPAEALKRSFRLVRGNWWRVFAVLVVLSLVMFGLGVVVAVPFALASWLAPGEASGVGDLIRLLGDITVLAVVPPVYAIAGTLLYYDLRVRKENYDMSELSRELGLAAASAGR